MGTARRLYVYIVAAISLFALTAGLASLLMTILREVEDAVSGSVILDGGASREQLSYSIALIAVGGPVFAIHWGLARRGVRAPGARGDEERASGVRAWYIAFVQAVALGAILAALIALVSTVLVRAFGGSSSQTWSESLAIAIVAVPVWTVFARARAAEIRTTRMAGAAAWFTRLYRYGGAYASLIVLLVGAAGLIATGLSVLVDRPDFGLDEVWWREVAAGQVASIVVGYTAWMLHWRDAGAAIRDAALIGEDERLTRLRAAYFGAVLVVAVSWCAVVVAGAIADLGRWALGVNGGDAMAFLEQVVGPPLAVVPVAVAAAWHARFATREAAPMGDAQQRATRRNGLILVSLVGLTFLSAGSVQLIDLAIAQVAAPEEESLVVGSGPDRQLPWYLAQLIVGAALWLPAWAGVLALRARDLAAERAAAVTRTHLFLVVGCATVTAVPAATMTLFRVIDTLLGGQAAQPLLVELSFPISVVAVAAVIGGYHGWLLLGDIRATGPVMETPAGGDEAGVQVGAGVAGAASAPVTAVPGVSTPSTAVLALELTVHAPPGTDMAALVAGLQQHMPPGSMLEAHNGTGEPELTAAR